MNHISRRAFGGLLASGASLAVLASTTPFAFAASRLRLIWWGNPDRDKRTNDGRRPLHRRPMPTSRSTRRPTPGTTTGRSSPRRPPGRTCPTSSRWITATSSNTRAAASSPTSTPFVGKQLDLADFDPNQLESGKVDGKLYGISMGANSMTHVYKPGAAAGARRHAARPDQMDDRRLRRDGQGGEGQAAGGHVLLREHGLSRAAAGDLGAPARQGALHRGRQARLRPRGPRPTTSPSGSRCRRTG